MYMYILVSVDVELKTQNIQMKLRKKEKEECVRKLSTLVTNLQKILSGNYWQFHLIFNWILQLFWPVNGKKSTTLHYEFSVLMETLHDFLFMYRNKA